VRSSTGQPPAVSHSATIGRVDELIRVARGVWRRGEAVADLAGRAAALLTAAPQGTVIGGLTAAQLHGLWLPDTVTGRVELLLRREAEVPEAHSHSRRREFISRRRRLLPDEVEVVDGLPVTTAARTWVDLGERLSLADLIAAGDSVLRGDVSVDELDVIVRRAFHRRGIVRVRAALPLLDKRSRSRPESHLRYALFAGGLPKPEVNEAVYNADGEWLGEPDLSYDDVRLAIEYNGAEHGGTKRMRRDITREVDIGFRGRWHTVTFGPAEVFGRPDQVAAYVRELRRERARLFR
jgi:hypothetical protein